MKLLHPLFLSAVLAMAPIPLAGQQAQPAATQPPVTITLQDALKMAQANSPQFRAAVTEAGVAHEDMVQARAGLLPSVSYNAQFLYTQGNGTPTGVFIANNAVHEYLSQGVAHQEIGLAPIGEFRRATALEAVARAKREVAARGLVVTVVKAYYGLVVAGRQYANAQQAQAAAQDFVRATQELEKGGEVAHADVVKAQLLLNENVRALAEAQLSMDTARLDLAVLLFPNFRQDFTVVDDLQLPPPLPPFAEVNKLALARNPELQQAESALDAARQDVLVAYAGHLPTLTLDGFYGIDATRFATYTGGVRNLGYAATATLNLPVFDWGAIQSKVKQAKLRRTQAQVELSFAQRALLAKLRGAYAEAQVSRSELDTLRDSADLAQQSARLTMLRYKAGEASVLEVVDAENTLAQARNAYDAAEERYRVALATLQTVTGTF